ncbi:hypothetical protein PCASD_23789 [Puccinia coronata f. sp. avenae]|uniref:Uncharacterized protein n=1 Tax=Puccinia coronata f. sp. avenae TaxID=200324 RepID=A0A2N5SZ54_9BASI|nr:hypothetical protein PCASD_23789 [Puccinia coronata f. sp. avenae]
MGGLTAILRSPNEAPPLIHVSPPLGTLHMVDQRRCCLLTAPNAKNRTASGLNHQSSGIHHLFLGVKVAWKNSCQKKKKTASPPLIQRSTLWLDGGPTKQSGPPLEICQNIVATVPTVEPGLFQRSCDPTVKPPEQIPTPTPPPQLTKVELTCSLWFENPFASPPAASPLAFASEETLYVIADAADPLRMELAEGVMTFGAFTNVIINEIGSAAPAAYHLQQVLTEASNLRHLRWCYIITQNDGSQSWTAEARLGNKHDTFIAAAHAFPAASRFEVLVKMDKPEEEVATIVTPGTHQPTTPRATPHQPTDSQLANNQVLNNQPAKDQLADNHPANNQPAKLPTPDLTLEQFFNICKIDFTNRQI